MRELVLAAERESSRNAARSLTGCRPFEIRELRPSQPRTAEGGHPTNCSVLHADLEHDLDALGFTEQSGLHVDGVADFVFSAWDLQDDLIRFGNDGRCFL
jgi:hypothetical protein